MLRACSLVFATLAASKPVDWANVEHTPEAGCFPENGCIGSVPAWVANYSTPTAGEAEQFWINYGATADSMVIGWLTEDVNAPSTVQYGTSPGTYTFSAEGTAATYTYSSSYTSGLIHHVVLTGLALNTNYYYHVGTPGTYGESMFTSNPGPASNNPYPFTFAFIGDVGESANAQTTVNHLLDALDVNASAILGDITYANGCEKNGCTTWDSFQRMLQVVTAGLPTSVVIGNHDMMDVANGIDAISSQYRFSGMPFPSSSTDGVFYFSYNAGPLHIITLASYYPGGFGAKSPMTTWLNADLASIDRAEYPWVVVVLHAPWYNSNKAHTNDGQTMRKAYEATLIQYKVNAIFSGHVHAYERSHPVDNLVVVPDGQGMIHITVGDGGASLYKTWNAEPNWSAFRSATFGHAELVIANATHALIEWHRNDQPQNSVADSYWMLNTV